MSRCVVDASAVLAWLFDERGAAAVDKVLGVSALSAVNLAEVLYRCDEVGMATQTIERDLEAIGVRMERFGADDAHRVEEVRRAGRRQGVRLSLADCCCLATGIRLALPVVGGDEAWRTLPLGLEVHPIR